MLQTGWFRLVDTKCIQMAGLPRSVSVLESAVIRRIFSLWKCTESAPLSEAESLGKKLLTNQQCRGGETGRRARLKILSKSVFTPVF